MKVEKTLIQTLTCQLSSTFMQLLFSFDQDMKVEKTLIQTLACQLLSTLMQLLFSFDQDMRVEKTLIQTLACQLSSTLIQLLFSFDQDTRVKKLSYKLSLVNFHSRLTRTLLTGTCKPCLFLQVMILLIFPQSQWLSYPAYQLVTLLSFQAHLFVLAMLF